MTLQKRAGTTARAFSGCCRCVSACQPPAPYFCVPLHFAEQHIYTLLHFLPLVRVGCGRNVLPAGASPLGRCLLLLLHQHEALPWPYSSFPLRLLNAFSLNAMSLTKPHAKNSAWSMYYPLALISLTFQPPSALSPLQ